MDTEFILRVQCADCPGLIHKITGILYNHNLNVVRNDEYVDPQNNIFFNRAQFTGSFNREQLNIELKAALSPNAEIELLRSRKKKIIVLVTKEHHCISDLLTRHEFGELGAEIKAVIGNHDVLRNLVEKFGIPYFKISHLNLNRAAHEELVIQKIKEFEFDYIVLAKYMRILTSGFVEQFQNKIINIHHSFLPAFIGANPYRQAYNRGVKIIGATAHFVTADLDEGPIIEQGIQRINHQYAVKEMAKAGREVERDVLFKALKKVFENRVMINGRKTIVF